MIQQDAPNADPKPDAKQHGARERLAGIPCIATRSKVCRNCVQELSLRDARIVCKTITPKVHRNCMYN
jgi:hypothetical protein